jgi:hypothetical protein
MKLCALDPVVDQMAQLVRSFYEVVAPNAPSLVFGIGSSVEVGP